jgi:hypothetical protein
MLLVPSCAHVIIRTCVHVRVSWVRTIREGRSRERVHALARWDWSEVWVPRDQVRPAIQVDRVDAAEESHVPCPPNDLAVQRPGSERKRGPGPLQRRVGQRTAISPTTGLMVTNAAVDCQVK